MASASEFVGHPGLGRGSRGSGNKTVHLKWYMMIHVNILYEYIHMPVPVVNIPSYHLNSHLILNCDVRWWLKHTQLKNHGIKQPEIGTLQTVVQPDFHRGLEFKKWLRQDFRKFRYFFKFICVLFSTIPGRQTGPVDLPIGGVKWWNLELGRIWTFYCGYLVTTLQSGTRAIHKCLLSTCLEEP